MTVGHVRVCRWCGATIRRAINGRWYARGNVGHCRDAPDQEHVPQTRRSQR